MDKWTNAACRIRVRVRRMRLMGTGPCRWPLIRLHACGQVHGPMRSGYMRRAGANKELSAGRYNIPRTLSRSFCSSQLELRRYPSQQAPCSTSIAKRQIYDITHITTASFCPKPGVPVEQQRQQPRQDQQHQRTNSQKRCHSVSF